MAAVIRSNDEGMIPSATSNKRSCGKAISRDTLAFVQDASQIGMSAARLSLENLLIPSEKACKIHFEDDYTE